MILRKLSDYTGTRRVCLVIKDEGCFSYDDYVRRIESDSIVCSRRYIEKIVPFFMLNPIEQNEVICHEKEEI